MKNDQTSLDAFIPDPAQREISRVLRFLLYSVEFSQHVLVFGERESAAHLLRTLALTHPDPGRHVGLIEKTAAGATLTMEMDATPVSSGDATVPQLIRAFIRQDPDVIAVSVVDDAETADLLITTALTGHQIFYTAQAETLDEALSALTTLVPKEGAYVRPGVVVKVGGAGHIERVWYRVSNGELEEVVSVNGEGVVVKKEVLPEVPTPTSPLHTPVFQSPVAEWPPAVRSGRTAYIPVVSTTVDSSSCIGGSTAHLPKGETWPVCRSCGLLLSLVVELNLAALPDLYRNENGIAQLFVCGQRGGGCDAYSETDPGVLAVVRPPEGLVRVSAPEHFQDVSVAPGMIVDWKEYTEDPDYADETTTETGTEADVTPVTSARHCDKLGGWPAWQQHNDWPLNDDGSRMTLLYQVAEGDLLRGGTSSGWDYDQAVHIPADNGERIIDPNFPHHFHSLWSGDAVGMLFIDATGTKLALRVQMT
jgi:Type II/IV secretion system protein